MTKDERIQELEDQVMVLEDALGLTMKTPIPWKLQPCERKILGLIAKQPEGAHFQRIFTVLYGTWDDPPLTNAIKVHISNMRKKLAPFGIEIQNRFGEGYALSPESRAIVKRACV